MKIKMKKGIAVLVAACLCLMSVSCATPSDSTEKTDGQSQESAGTRTFVDSAGREVEVPETITRIIPSGDMAQMLLWPLAADELVSVATPVTEEQEKYLGTTARDLPETGNLYKTGSELNVEEVASLDAQIIIDFGEAKDSITEDLDNLQELLGIPCVFIEGGLEDSAEAYRMLGELLGKEEQAEELASYIDTVIDTTQQVFKTTEKKEAVILSGSDGLGCVASGTYFDEVWAYMLKNVAQVDDAQMYASTSIDFEQLASWDPDYLFCYNGADPEDLSQRAEWSQLSAVQNGQCYAVPEGPYSFVSPPTVNRYLAIIWIADQVYPGVFPWDTEQMVKEYYQLFYHYTLSDADYDALMGDERGATKS